MTLKGKKKYALLRDAHLAHSTAGGFGFRAAARAGGGGLLPPLYPRMAMRAHESRVGVVGGEQKTRGVGSEKAWWSIGLGRWERYMYWGFTDPACASSGPTVAKLPAKPFSAVFRDAALLLKCYLARFAQLAIGSANPTSNRLRDTR